MKELWLYGEIGPRQHGMIDAQSFVEDLPAREPVTVRINSPGGNVFDGLAIHNALRRHAGHVTAEIDAVAASAASLVAMAADDIVMADNSMIMIHNPWSISVGDSKEHGKNMEVLAKVQSQFIDVYARRTRIDADRIARMMSDETWFTSVEAIDEGFAEHVGDSLDVAACLGVVGKKFKNAPIEILNRAVEKVTPADRPEKSVIVRSPHIAARRVTEVRLRGEFTSV